METTKFCKDCFHYILHNFQSCCNRLTTINYNLVTGEKEDNFLLCSDERKVHYDFEDKCGINGKYFKSMYSTKFQEKL